MQIPRPPAVGDQDVVGRLRTVLFSEPILGAVALRPKGYLWVVFAPALGWWAPYLARKATDPLPPTTLYLAVTPVDIRLFSRGGLRDVFEIGRWKKGAYRASAAGSRLDLEVERLGRIALYGGRAARRLIEMVLRGASGPTI